MPGPSPVSTSRAARQGKIRWAIRGSRGFPETLNTFRFTSPDRVAIEALAEKYGGESRPWDEPSASERNQFEVITDTNEIDVWLVPGQMWKGYEHWQGGTCERRCDGEQVEVTEQTADGSEIATKDCFCLAAQEMTCKPKVRFSVIIPEVPFGGVWQIDTSSWAAWHSIPDMAEMLSFMQGGNEQLEPARLLLTDQSKKVREKGKVMTKRFKVIQLILPRSPMEIMSGSSGLAALQGSSESPVELAEPARPALAAVPELQPAPEVIDASSTDIVDAVEVQEFQTIAAAIQSGLKRNQVEKVDGIWRVK